jgi:sortase A
MAIGRLITRTVDDRGLVRADGADGIGAAALLWLERLLLIVGVAALGYFLYVNIETRLYQAMENRELDTILAAGPPMSPLSTPVAVRPGSAIGRIEIPRLGVSSVIRAGVDARTLQLAVGHIPGTALPGNGGNIGLAGHRDTFFRKLRDIRTFDEIRVVTPNGTFSYEVERTRIVKPQDTWVLEDTSIPSVTLVTCYPFTYVGSAPDRFIVRAIARAAATRQ